MNKQLNKATMNSTETTRAAKSKNIYIYRADGFAEIQQLLEDDIKDRYAFGKRAKSKSSELKRAIKKLMSR